MRRKIHGDEGDVRTEKCQGRLTVYFEDPFWVGVFERIENGKLSAAKVTFGAEPKDYEVQEFVSRHYYHLQYSPAIKTDLLHDKWCFWKLPLSSYCCSKGRIQELWYR